MVEPGGGGDGLRAQRPPERSHVVAVRGGPARVGVPRTTRAQTVLVGPGHRWWSGPPAELTLQRSLRGGGGQSRCARPGAAAGVSRGGGDAVADLPWVGVRAGEGHGCQQRELPDSGQAVRAQHPRGAWPWLRACGKAEQVQAARERRGSAEAGAGSRGLIPGSSAEPDPRAPGQVHMRWSMWLRVGRARGCGCRARGQQPARCPSKLEPSSEGTHSCCLTPWPRWLPQTLGRRDLEEERSGKASQRKTETRGNGVGGGRQRDRDGDTERDREGASGRESQGVGGAEMPLMPPHAPVWCGCPWNQLLLT